MGRNELVEQLVTTWEELRCRGETTSVEREARAAAALDHDHIVRIYEVGEDQGVPYLSMQLLHGQTLSERLQQGHPLSNAEVLRIGREIAEGLAVAHACGLVHRDVKPANVWLEEGSGRIKILDFGLARAANETARLTQDGSLLGTPAFMSPEQAGSSGELDHRSDLFSLGSVLYRMVTGRLPFPAESTAALLLALVRDNPVAPRQLNPRIAPALDELIMGLLAKDPAARPQSAQAVVETIQRLEQATVPAAWGGLDLKVQVKDEERSLPRAPKRFPVALAVLVVIAGLAAGSALLLPRLRDAAGNTGELILDSPASAVAVTVTRGGRPVGVLDPARRPTLRLPAGSYGLELADTTGTLVLAGTQVDLRRGTRQVVSLVRNIPVASARNRAAALVAALEQAGDRAAKATVIAAAAPLDGMLETLTERAAGDALFQAELARHFAANGNPSSADAARTKARTLFEARLAKEPENPGVAADLAQLLLEIYEIENPIRWTVLKPVVADSALGAILSILPDNSILASGPTPFKDRYLVLLTVNTAIDLAGVRLEALTHPSLPGNGPGRSPVGSFSQISWKVTATPPDREEPITLQFDNAWADHQSTIRPIQSDGHWNIGGSQGGNCTAIWSMSNRVRLASDAKLTFEMQCQTGNESGENLGRFRLSVSGDPTMFARQRRRFAAMKLDDPWARLAAAYRLAGDQQALDGLLKHHVEAVAAIGDLYAADQDWEHAIAEYRKGISHQPADGALLTKLATAYQFAGRTREAVPHLVSLSSAHPEDTILSLKVAALQAWFGQEEDLAATRQRVLAFAQDTNSATTASRAAKVCSILPCTETAELEAALTLGRTAVKLGQGGEWNLLSLGMAEYRSGNDDDDEKALLAAPDAGPTNDRYVTGTSQFFRAMSLFRQGKPDEARQLAIAAAAMMKPLPTDERNPLADNASHDDLILWLAHKEAKAMIQFDAPVAAPATPGGK